MDARGELEGRGRPPSTVRQIAATTILAAGVFAAEWLLGGQVAVGALYILPVTLSFSIRRARHVDLAASICTVLTVTSLFAARPDELQLALVHRAVALFAIWVTAHLGKVRARNELAIANQRKTLGVTLQSIADAVITTDARERITLINDEAEMLTGWSAKDAQGKRLAEVFNVIASSTDANHPSLPATIEEDVIPSMHEIRVRSRQGNILTIEASSAPIFDTEESSRPLGRVLVFHDISARKAHEATVEALAYRDPLTGLANRTSFLDRLDLELAHAKRRGARMALCFIDMDGFKVVNDTLGHAIGDRLLQSIANRLREALREEDTIARLGGDEFTVILPEIATGADAVSVARKLVDALRPPHQIEGHSISALPSVGIAIFPDEAETPDKLLRQADAAMYLAKSRGGGRWQRAEAK